MAVRVVRSLNQASGRFRKRASIVARDIRATHADSLLKHGSHVVITRGTTATGKGQIVFRAAKLGRGGKRSHRRHA